MLSLGSSLLGDPGLQRESLISVASHSQTMQCSKGEAAFWIGYSLAPPSLCLRGVRLAHRGGPHSRVYIL